MSQQLPHYKNLRELYYEYIMPLRERYRVIEARGIKVDFEQRKFLKDKYTIILKEKQDKLASLAGREINYNSNAGKNGQVPRLIYGDLQCPVRAGVDDDTLTNLKNNVLLKHSKWNKAIETIDLVLDCRKVHKLINTYIKARPDIDGRMRCRYRLTLETGRTSTSILKSPDRYEKYGIAFQTLTKHAEFGQDLLSMFVPDPGKIAVEIDGSQAEARVVLLLCQDYDLLEKLDDPLFDLHLLTTSYVFPKPLEPFKIPGKPGYFDKKKAKELRNPKGEPYRQYGKKFRHASNYDMGANEGATQMNLPVNKVRVGLEEVHKNCPNIKGIFHKQIQEQLGIDRTLWTPIGRRREFFEKWGDRLFKEAYAHIPQSSITDLTKYALMSSALNGVDDILWEKHDSFLFQTEPENLDRDIAIATEFMESEIDFSTCSLPREKLVVPSEVTLYRNNLHDGEAYVKEAYTTK